MSSTAGAVGPARAVADGTVADGRVVERQLAAATGVALVVLLIGVALWLVVRRLSGAFSSPLGGVAIVAAAVFVALAAWAIRRLARSTVYLVLSTQYGRQVATLLFIVPTVCAVAILASLSLLGTPVLAVVIAWLLLIGGEAAYWLPRIRPRSARASESPGVVEEQEIPAGLVQQITRVRDGDRESIHVVAQVEIAAGDRVGAVHVAFCPPLEGRPELTAHVVDADDVEVRVTQAESFGTRAEVRATRAHAEARSVMIEVLGSAKLVG